MCGCVCVCGLTTSLLAKCRRLWQVAAMAASSATGTTNLCNTGTSCFCHAWKELAKVNSSQETSEYPPIIPIMHREYHAGFATCNSYHALPLFQSHPAKGLLVNCKGLQYEGTPARTQATVASALLSFQLKFDMVRGVEYT